MWRDFVAVYRKELKTYFVSPIAFIVIMLFVAGLAWKFFYYKKGFFVWDRAELYQGFFSGLDWILVLLVSLIGMRGWASEESGGTIESLMTLPLRTGAIVLGKYFAALTLVLACLVATAGIPITVSSVGDLDWGPVWGGYLGAFLFSAALLALALWVSALTRHQIVALVVSLVCGAAFIAMNAFAEHAGTAGEAMLQLSLSAHYQALGRGVVDMRDVYYFISFALFFLWVNTQTVENRRYR